LSESFGLILAIPDFQGRVDQPTDFIADTLTGAALENLLGMVSEDGLLITAIPAGFTFGGGSVEKLRAWISEHYGIEFFSTMPEGAFRPYAGVKTYLIGLKNGRTKRTHIGNLHVLDEQLFLKNEQWISEATFRQSRDWRIELFLSEHYSDLEK